MPTIPADRIVIRSPNWLGDAMMVTPAVSAVRHIYPESYIAVVTKSSLAELWEVNPNVTEIIELPAKRNARNIIQFAKTLEIEKFDLGILFTNSISSTLEFSLAKISNRLGYQSGIRGYLLTHAVKSNGKQKHMIQHSMDLVAQLGDINGASDSMIFPLIPEWNDKVDKIFEENNISSTDRIIGINSSAAYGTAKRWLPERYIELTNRLFKEFQARIVLFGGPNEKEDIQEISRQISPSPVNLAGKTSLGELAACLSRCHLFVTNDSGSMHVAAALGVPMVAIFGSTDVVNTGPYGKGKIEIIRKRPECAPCLLRECPIDHRCMTAITVDEVYESCLRLLQSDSQIKEGNEIKSSSQD